LNKLLVVDPQVFKRLRDLPKPERSECLLALCELVETFGQPHVHSGLGIRKLGGRLFECRGNLALRILFQNRADDLYICFLGNHDEVKTLLRAGRYH
jgi:hypothetical protein